MRAVGSQRALDLGGLMNLLARLDRALVAHGRRMTEAQRRLIVRRIREMGADDAFGLSRDHQMRMLTEIVGAYTRMTPAVVQSYLRTV